MQRLKAKTSFASISGTHKTFQGFAARDGAIMRDGSEMVVGLITQRKMATPFAAIVNASSHDKARRS
jgi:hypothetical protein